ncbi:OmpH family outer membrane protein [Mariniblastus sp.]|mgnify:CR=1 FL=1|nr:OmpH family outer membrane protein [Mariniblastus sp.]MDA7928560.1 OmpH family outer membrane protein [Mariniblastus sp.]MDB4380580.1 OmpH family outer membrane protein [Mariniblastus sp.]MDB4386213.1 OmpH family outer membrane protein [bacterium]MDB4460263.1 OmpH family outer membrane protein [bacterium]
MKTKRRIATILTVLTVTALINLSSVSAQQKVAIVDIPLIFKSHVTFGQRLDGLKTEAENFKTESMNAQQRLMTTAKQLEQSDIQPGTAEFKREETALAQQAAKMEVDQKDTMRGLMQREAQLHYQTYRSVNEVIQQYCERNNIALVLKFNRAEIDPANPRTVMQKVNGNVIYHVPQNDITDQIIARVNQIAAAQNPGGTLQK